MNLSQLINAIKSTDNREDLDDALVTSWIRVAEQEMSKHMRVADQILVVVETVNANRFTRPADWVETDYIHTDGGKSLRYKPRDIFYQTDEATSGFYTTSGNYIILGGDVSAGVDVEMYYFAAVPALGETALWTTTKYLRVFLDLCLAEAAEWTVDDQRAGAFRSRAMQAIQKANEDYKAAHVSGSFLTRGPTRKRRGFGV